MKRAVRIVAIVSLTLASISGAGGLLAAGPTGQPQAIISQIESYQAQQREIQKIANERYTQKNRVGETFDLTGIDCQLPGNEKLKDVFVSHLGWIGTLRFTVLAVQHHTDLESANFTLWQEYEPERLRITNGRMTYLTVDLEITNVNAVDDGAYFGTHPVPSNWIRPFFGMDVEYSDGDSTTQTLDYAFSATLHDNHPSEATISDGYFMDLPVGETRHVRLLFPLNWPKEATLPREFSCKLKLESYGGSDMGSCTVDLGKVKGVSS